MARRFVQPDDLLRFVFVGDPQWSPDGTQILFSKKRIDPDKNRYVSNLVSVDVEGRLTEWTQGAAGAAMGRWSPDGRHILFVSGREDKLAQLWLLPTSGGEARKLTDFPEGSLGEVKWSPDGTKIALTFRETHPDWTQKAAKEREQKGLSTPPREIDHIWYRLDGDGYFLGQRYRLGVFSIPSEGTLKPDDALFWYEGDPIIGQYGFDWSPDSTELAVVHNVQKQPFTDPPNQQIFRLDLEGRGWRLEGQPKGSKDNPRWSPDGKWIAYVGDVAEDDPWGTNNTKLYVVPAGGGEARDLTGTTDFCLSVGTLSDTKEAEFGSALHWNADSTGLWVQVGWHGAVQIGYVDLAAGGVSLATEGHHTVSCGSLARDGRIAAVYGTATRLPEIAVVEPELATGRLVPRILTSLNLSWHEEVRIAEPEEFWIDSTEGGRVQGWIMLPPDYLAPKRIPAVLEIHGGPHAQYGWTFFHEFQVLAASGYAVVYTNPRGSKGYGQGHCAAIKGDWGHRDWEDIQAVTRWMQHHPAIHPGQMGVMGGSYGGYMTNWVIGHTHDFRAAITDRCVSNIVSMAGSSDFPFNKDAYFKGLAWGDHEQIRELWRQSPLAYFEGVKTPTLVIHSEGDLRCNVEQGEQVFTALQMQGVESRFVRYPQSTSHGMSRSGPPDLRLHRLGEILAWWKRFL